jgi:TetR/AcrR family transcriptional regulator, fatty acid metabolism regulator protein
MSPYRTTPKMAERKQHRRQRFLDEALKLFGRHGYHETTVPMIVRAAKGSTGNFYFYFRNKEDVFAAVLQRAGERLSEAIHRAIARRRDTAGQMEAAVRAMAAYLGERPDEARVLIVESSALSPRLTRLRREILAGHTRGVEQALASLGAKAAVTDPRTAARCWVGAVHEAVYGWLEDAPATRRPLPELGRAIARFNLQAIGVKGRR